MLKVIFAAILASFVSFSALAKPPSKDFDLASCDRAGAFAGEIANMFMHEGEVVDMVNATDILNRGALKNFVDAGSKATMDQVTDAQATGWLKNNTEAFNNAQQYYLIKHKFPLDAAKELVGSAMKGMCYRQLAGVYEEQLKKVKK